MNLEAISLLRILPAGGADLGEATREDMRQADVGKWSDPCGRQDDLRETMAAADAPTEEHEALPGFDAVVPLGEADARPQEPVVELRFSEG